jgi:glucan 1,3-beta-glucosidase
MNDCAVGFDLFVGGTTKEEQGVGAEAIIDAVATDVPVFVRTSKPRGGSLVLQNAVLRRCATAVGSPGEPDALPGDPDGEVTIRRWARGRAYTGTRKEVTMVEGPIAGGQLAPTLLDRHGRVVSRPRPQYEFCGIDEFVSVRAEGAVGDGETVSVPPSASTCCAYGMCRTIRRLSKPLSTRLVEALSHMHRAHSVLRSMQRQRSFLLITERTSRSFYSLPRYSDRTE